MRNLLVIAAFFAAIPLAAQQPAPPPAPAQQPPASQAQQKPQPKPTLEQPDEAPAGTPAPAVRKPVPVKRTAPIDTEGKVVEEIVHGRLRIVAVGDALIQPIEDIPFLVRISQDARALAGEAPVKGIHHAGCQNRGVTDHETLAVIRKGLFRGRAGQKRRLRIIHILQRASPEQTMLAIARQVVVHSCDEGVVIEAEGRSETES